MISVIIPAYNIAQYIERCVMSILNQTYSNFEILIVDDGSTDETPQICDKLASYDSRVRVFHKSNGGVSSARNYALSKVRGELISMIDGDDWIEPTLFEDAVNMLNEHNAQVFMYEYIIEQGEKHKVCKLDDEKYGLLKVEDALIHSVLPDNRFLWSKIFCANLLQNCKFDENIILGEDTLFICEIIGRAEKVFYSSSAYYHYIVRENSAITSSFNIRKMSGLDAYSKNLMFCKKHGFMVATQYARGAIVDLAVALCRKASNTSEKKEAYKIAKKYIQKNLIGTIISKYVTRKTKFKAIVGAFSIHLTVRLCNRLGEKM